MINGLPNTEVLALWSEAWKANSALRGSGLDPKRPRGPRGPRIVKELHAEIAEVKRARKVRTVSLRG